MILSTLESHPTHIVTSPSTSLCSFCNSCFELIIIATEPVSNTQGLLWTLVKYTSITCISYILLFNLPSFLSAKYLGQFRFQWLLCSRGTQFQAWVQLWASSWEQQLACYSYLKFLFLFLCPFLETSGLVNHQHLMLFLDFYLHRFQHREELGNTLFIPCIL